ncbi:MAG: hypothetical protein BroJett025_03970 [Patescibacteria group bacterium]|nr:MAG: hypothetical protein BroJett025_03970 [Patescibacteria group bacterium]
MLQSQNMRRAVKTEAIGQTGIIQKFEAIKLQQSIFRVLRLPRVIPELAKSPEDVKKTIESAATLWSALFDNTQLTQSLKTYIELSANERKQNFELRKYLKELRKAGLLLKSALDCYSEDGAPETFNTFLSQLGKTNDAYDTKQGNKYAQKVLSLIESSDLNAFSFTPTSTNVCASRINIIKSRSLAQIQSPNMLVPIYHDLRKDLRHLKNLYQVAAMQNPSNRSLIQTFHYLGDLSTQLGKVHDQYAKQKMMDKAGYEVTQMRIPSQLHRKLKLFYSRLKV